MLMYTLGPDAILGNRSIREEIVANKHQGRETNGRAREEQLED
jgi:hypothetical protein